MPVSYEIDREAGRIETRCTGDVTLDDVLRHFEQLRADPSTPDRLDVLLDLEGMTSIPESTDLHQVTRAVDRLTVKLRWGACAIVASRDSLFGMSRMFAVFSEGLFAQTQVFRERQAAERWLAAARPPTRR